MIGAWKCGDIPRFRTRKNDDEDCETVHAICLATLAHAHRSLSEPRTRFRFQAAISLAMPISNSSWQIIPIAETCLHVRSDPLYPLPIPFPSQSRPRLRPSLTPPHPPPHRLIHTGHPFPTSLDLEPLAMLLPATRTRPLDPLARQFQMNQSLHPIHIRDLTVGRRRSMRRGCGNRARWCGRGRRGRRRIGIRSHERDGVPALPRPLVQPARDVRGAADL